jgi:aerobic-type carbon monoxide dehydrogenase small subunit (CoxS/CutS family)
MSDEKPGAPRPVQFRVTVNGRLYEATAQPRMSLVDWLRHDAKLTGSHVGCEHGVCGACTVLLDGIPVRACLVLAIQADGSTIETVEDLAQGGHLGRLQRAFMEHHALQCGFCTPGFLMLASAYLRTHAVVEHEEVRALVASNLCRCTGYQPIVDAILEVASLRKNP